MPTVNWPRHPPASTSPSPTIGLEELRNLVALRQVRIEIVLAVEDRAVVDLRLEAKPGAHRLLDALLVDHRQHAGHGRIDQRDIGVGLAAEFGRAPENSFDWR
jgi:predicted nucleic acid-binding protein